MKKQMFYIFGYIIVVIIMYFSFFDLSSELIIEDVYLKLFSFNPITEELNLRNFLFTFFNLVCASYIFSNEYCNYIGKYGKYIFVRTKRGGGWIVKNWSKRLVSILIFYISIYSLLFIFLNIFTVSIIVNQRSIYIILVQLVSLVITIFMSVSVIDTISYYYNETVGFIVTFISIIISFISIVLLDIGNLLSIIKYIPFTQHLITIQEIDIEFIPKIIFNESIQGYMYSGGIVYNLLIVCICFGISYQRLKTMDII